MPLPFFRKSQVSPLVPAEESRRLGKGFFQFLIGFTAILALAFSVLFYIGSTNEEVEMPAAGEQDAK